MIVSKWTASHVKALRCDALRMNRPEFNERTGWAVKTIEKWEALPDGKVVTGAGAATLDSVYAALTDDERARMHAALGIEDEVNRRQFTSGVALMGATLLPDRPPAQAISAPAPADSPRLSLDEVRRWLDLAESLEQRDQHFGGAGLVQEATAALLQARNRLDTAQCDPATATAAASAVGNLAVMTGWVAYDADQQTIARQCYQLAMELAACSGDDELNVHALVYRANQEVGLSRLLDEHGTPRGNPHRALQYAFRAEQLARTWKPGRLHALIAIRKVQAYARTQDNDGFRTALGQAHSALDTAMESELISHTPRWLRFVDAAEFAGHEARAYADLGDHRAALALYEQALQGQGVRNELNTRAWYAAQLAALGDANGAVIEAEPVLTSLEAVRSTRTLRVLAPIRALPAATRSGFADRYDHLDQKALA